MSEELKIQIKQELARFCAYQERCWTEIYLKLKPYQLSSKDTDEIADWLQRENFWNESRFALSFVNGKLNHSKWGRIKIKYHLFVKKVNSNIVDEAMATINESHYRQIAEKIFLLKLSTLKNEKDTTKLSVKLIQFLSQKGFEQDISYDLLRKHNIMIGQ